MNVDQIMSTRLVTAKMDDPLKKVKKIFDKTHFHHLMVVDGSKLYGIISDRDLLEALSPNIDSVSETLKDRASLSKRVHQVMSRKPITLTPKANIYEAISIFNSTKISCIPIVDDKFQPVGIVSWRDILKKLESMRTLS